MKNKIILKIVLATLFICLTIFLVFILSKSMKTEESENVKEDIKRIHVFMIKMETKLYRYLMVTQHFLIMLNHIILL